MVVLHKEQDQINNLVKVELSNLQAINQKLVSLKLGYYFESRLPSNYFYYIKALELEFHNNLEQLILILKDFYFNYNIKTLIKNPNQKSELNKDFNLLKGSILTLVQLIKFKFQLDLKINLKLINNNFITESNEEDIEDSRYKIKNNMAIEDHISFFNDLIEKSTSIYNELKKSFSTILNWNSSEYELNGNSVLKNDKSNKSKSVQSTKKLSNCTNHHNELKSNSIKSWFNKKLQSIH